MLGRRTIMEENSIGGLVEAWRGEMEAEALYVRLAKRESDPEKAALLEGMASAKVQQRARIERRLRQLGAIPPRAVEFWLPLGLRIQARFGSRDRLLTRLEEQEQRLQGLRIA
jgi:hypothetical protein